MAKETKKYYNVEDLIAVSGAKDYNINYLLALPCKNDELYIFETKQYVPAKDYKVLSRVSVSPLSIIKNEHRLNETRENYNISPITVDGINSLQKTLSNYQETLSEVTYNYENLYVFQDKNKAKDKHICYRFDEGGFWNILEKKLINENQYEFVGRLDLLRVKFNRLFTGLFYFDEKDVQIFQDIINDPNHLIVSKDSNDSEKGK